MTYIKTFYDNGICPDCHHPINDTTVEGEDCPNCGHIFWLAYENNDTPDEEPKPIGM
jgi:Zn finger protein HypA/HybF involved in hydrogenase expression